MSVMKNKWILLSVCVVLSLLLCACQTAPSETPVEESSSFMEATSSEETTDATPDPFESVRQSKELWLSYGLSAYENGETPDDLTDFFSDRANMTYLTLYDHMFIYDRDTSVSVAEALFRFIYEEYGAEALLDMEKRVEYKNAYLTSLESEATYTQTPEVEVFLASAVFSTNADHKYIFTFDNITYYFEDFGEGSPSQYHGFLFFSTTGLQEMIDYLKANGLDEGLNTERDFNFYMTLDGGYSKTLYASGDMYINESNSTLHEAIHAMGIDHRDNEHIWLSEGICNYFGKALGFQDQVAASYIQLLMMAERGYFDELAASGDETAIQQKAIYTQYIAQGGTLETVETFDLRLCHDVSAKIELDTDHYITIGEAYRAANKSECHAVGQELSYMQATSMVTYLVEQYGVETVMDAYWTGDIAGVFGKDYEDLKAEWQAYLYSYN